MHALLPAFKERYDNCLARNTEVMLDNSQSHLLAEKNYISDINQNAEEIKHKSYIFGPPLRPCIVWESLNIAVAVGALPDTFLRLCLNNDFIILLSVTIWIHEGSSSSTGCSSTSSIYVGVANFRALAIVFEAIHSPSNSTMVEIVALMIYRLRNTSVLLLLEYSIGDYLLFSVYGGERLLLMSKRIVKLSRVPWLLPISFSMTFKSLIGRVLRVSVSSRSSCLCFHGMRRLQSLLLRRTYATLLL